MYIQFDKQENKAMKNELLKIEDDLDITYSAYESLQVLLTGSQTDSKLVSPILLIMNDRLKMVIKELNKARRGNESKNGALVLTVVSSNQL